MSRHRVPSPQTLWEIHTGLVLKVLAGALKSLRQEIDLPVDEEPLNRNLYLAARNAYFDLEESERPQYFALTPTPEQTPENVADVETDWIRKRPDFKWRVQNGLAVSPEELTRDFDIECKRLGEPTSRNWVLTKQYVVNGIARFLSAEHRYGNRTNQGAMIGYVQDWEFSDILKKMNDFIEKMKKPQPPAVRFARVDWEKERVVQTTQRLTRESVRPSDFSLHHLWVDLRQNTARALG